jgi:putative endonuclease
MNKKYISYIVGIAVEYLSMIILIVKGYSIISRRKKTPLGEIDILAKKNNIFYVIEVKYRSSNINDAKAALLKSKNRLLRAALWLRLPNDTQFLYFIWSGFTYEINDLIEV